MEAKEVKTEEGGKKRESAPVDAAQTSCCKNQTVSIGFGVGPRVR